MNIFTKHQITKLIFENNYRDLTRLLRKVSDKDLEIIFKSLNRVDAYNYLEFLVRYRFNQNLILSLALYSSYIKIQDIIFYIDLNSYDKTKLDSLIACKFPEFLDLIKKKYLHNNIISYLIRYCIKNNQVKELDSIKEELLKGELTSDIIKLFSSQNLYSPEFRTKLITSGPDNIITYLKSPYFSNLFLEEYITSYPKIKDLKYIASDLINYNKDIYFTLIKLVLKLDNTNPVLKSEYLLCLLELNLDNIYRHEIIANIITLHDINVVKKLMKHLDSEKQAELNAYYLNTGNLDIILSLAVSTNTTNTCVLIDYVLATHNSDAITHLIGNLEAKYLDYALAKIFHEEGITTYLSLINNLYLFDYANVLPAIDYIFISNLHALMDVLIINRLLSYRETMLNKLTLIKN